jgi:two-component system, OmpR family, sensor histidine kinase KdpD
MQRTHGPTWVGFASAAAGVAAMTTAIRLTPGASATANVSMLYLLVVIGAAVAFGSGPAVLASVLSFLAFNWFFVEPRHTFAVGDPADWIALLTFLLVATVTGHLTARLNQRAEEVRLREREAVALAEASWAVASQVDRERALAEVLRRLTQVTEVDAAAILILDERGDPMSLATAGPAQADLPSFREGAAADAVRRVMESPRSTGWTARGAPQGLGTDAAYLPLAVEDRVLGALYLRLRPGSPPTAAARRAVESLATHAAVVLERDRLLRAETEARALSEADRLKTALLSMVSHDFRSPLTSIKASVGGLLQDGAATDPDTRRELLRGIDEETDRLNRMVGNILALSRLEADAWRPQCEATSVPELIGAALDSFGAEENRRIRVRVEEEVPEASLDPVQMVQVLRNLVDNALKYSAAESEVELRAWREEGRLVLEVQDRGIGLPPGDHEQIFEPFFRAPHLQESAIPGVGIGLAVCRGLVEAHHGELSAQPRPGGGATFRITLPLPGFDTAAQPTTPPLTTPPVTP